MNLNHLVRATGPWITIACCSILLTIGCSQNASNTAAVRPPANAATLRITTDAVFPPFHFVRGNAVTGYDVELAKLVGRSIGRDPIVSRTAYEDLLAGLDRGQHDLVAATQGLTAERQARYALSTPYFETCQAFVVRRGPGEPTSRADLRGRRVGASGSGTSMLALRSLSDVVQTPIAPPAKPLDELLAGRIDAWVIDEFEAVQFARENAQRLTVLPEPAAPEQYVFVMAAKNTELQQRVNTALERLKAAGELDRLQEAFKMKRGPDWPVKLAASGM